MHVFCIGSKQTARKATVTQRWENRTEERMARRGMTSTLEAFVSRAQCPSAQIAMRASGDQIVKLSVAVITMVITGRNNT